jgi:hypothetical protein
MNAYNDVFTYVPTPAPIRSTRATGVLYEQISILKFIADSIGSLSVT